MKKISRYLAIFLLTMLLLGNLLATETLILEGNWEKVDYRVKGKWQIVKKSDGFYVQVDKDFKTRSGPDLHILFSNHRVSELTNSNATPSSVIIGELKKNKGAQEWKIPSGLNWQDYKSIAIHCVAYSHLWAGANF